MSRTMLITGAAGHLGGVLAARLRGRYELRLTDLQPPTDGRDLPFVMADIADLETVRVACRGVDTVIHLAAEPDPQATWEQLIEPNVVGIRNILEAAISEGCRRVIFASSINAVAGYPSDVQVRTDMPVRPYNLYGATKAWGEAIGRYYADQCGLSVICLRLGWVLPRDSSELYPEQPYLYFVLTHDDFIRAVEAGVEASDDLRFGIFHAISDNRWKRLDIDDARRVLGYRPRDDAFALAEGT